MTGVSIDADSVIKKLQDKNRRVECFNFSQSSTEIVQFLDITIECPDSAMLCNFQCNLCNEDYWTCGGCDNFKQHKTKRLALMHKGRCHKKRSFNDSSHINEENDEEIIDDLSMHEALTEDLCFNYDEDILPCESFSERLKQHDKITKHHVHHLHNNDLPRHLVFLGHHNRLFGKSHNELL